jgi:hypothetical protein
MYIVLHVSYDLQEVEPCPHLFFFFMCLCRYSLEVYTWLGVNTQSDSISHLKFILFMMTGRKKSTEGKKLDMACNYYIVHLEHET